MLLTLETNFKVTIPFFTCEGFITSIRVRKLVRIIISYPWHNFVTIYYSANVNKLKTVPPLEDQLPAVLHNLCEALAVPPKPLADYQPGFGGTMTGPLIVVLGHGIEDGFGVGPDLPGSFLPFCLWLCCCFGPPCSTPAGKFSTKFKSDFNLSITVKKGEGMTR
jgi:hypothetical protein